MYKISVIQSYKELDQVDSVVRLISEQMKVVKGETKYDRISKSLEFALSNDSRAKLFLVSNEEEYVGFAFGNVCSGLESGGNYLWINELYIDLSHRGKNLGSTLLAFIENWCKEKNIKYMACITGVSNEAAKSMYKKNGYDLNEVVWVDKELD